MEQRQSERVQFFQLTRNDEVLPVWVFHRAQADTVLGLLLNISPEGIQVLTDKAHPMQGGHYRLHIHGDETGEARFIAARVRCLWSKADGTLYTRNGFAFEGETELAAAIEKILAAREAGQRWLRCELASVPAGVTPA